MAGQIALPLPMRRADDPSRIVVGNANRAAVDALADQSQWPFATAILAGPPRSGKTLLARWAGRTDALPDLRSRLGAALHLAIGVPDDDMVAALIEAHADARGLALGEGALTYLVPRLERSFAGIEAVVAAIDRLTLERKVPPTLSVWRDALDAVQGAEQPRLL